MDHESELDGLSGTAPRRLPLPPIPINGRQSEHLVSVRLRNSKDWRTRKVQRAVDGGLRSWEKAQHHVSSTNKRVPLGGLLPADIRARLAGPVDPSLQPSQMRMLNFNSSNLYAAWRLLVYSTAAIEWLLWRVIDWAMRRGSMELRAVRLRQILERVGGTAVKLGQQASIRIDLVPYMYAAELSKMLDDVPPFSVEHARNRLQQRLGCPLQEVFRELKPVPIGSASIACVWEAYLHSGERVAVKVRRPGIGEKFIADCKALAGVLKLLEFFTVLRPGLSRNFMFEFRSMLLEELDFVKEARYTELFRRRVRKHMKWVSAPKIFPEFTCDDILVTEFVAGIWLRELLAAVERRNDDALDLLKQYNISPKVVARRLIRTNQFGIFENLLFHADPHPSNVVIQPGNRLVFIDFGSCGAYTSRERNDWRQLAYYHDNEDIGRMVQSALAILEPLPPIDIDEFSKRLEMVFWQDLYAFRSKNSEWWERTSARIWISFLDLAREYSIPMNLNMLRMIRSTLLYETLAARLYKDVNAYREHRKYNQDAGQRAKKRIHKKIHRWMFRGFSNSDYLRIEQFFNMGNRAIYLAQRSLDTPLYRFSLLVSKTVYAITVIIRGTLRFILATLGGAFLVMGYSLLKYGQRPDIMHASVQVLRYWPFQVLVALMVLFNTRRIMFRLFDKDVRGQSSSGLN